jgi:crossover junction endodeoxyribonuclease RuvC
MRTTLLEAGVISARADAPLEMRLGLLHRGMRDVLAATRPDIVVVEELWSSPKHPITAVLMGHARGVLYLAAHESGVPVRDLVHSLVKRVLAGSGSARKAQVKLAVMHFLGLKAAPEPDDVSDALALALTFVHVEATERRLPATLGVRSRARKGK